MWIIRTQHPKDGDERRDVSRRKDFWEMLHSFSSTLFLNNLISDSEEV